MDGSLNQPCRVEEEGPMGCKLLLQPCRVREEGPMGCKPLLTGSNKGRARSDESTGGISIG